MQLVVAGLLLIVNLVGTVFSTLGLTVGLVLAMSADAVREWVSVGRKERHVDVSLHGVSIH
jgi:hypothetical protein